MTTTQSSRLVVFRRIVNISYYDWSAYTATPLYDRRSIRGLEEDVRVLATVWFDHDAHDSIEEFVVGWPVAYVDFQAHDRYTDSTTYDMEQLVRAFLLKEIHGWDHETALRSYLAQGSSLCRRLGFDSVPDQSTLWRSWHYRFTTDLQEFLATAARTILSKADDGGGSLPREPSRTRLQREARTEDDDECSSGPSKQELASHVGRIVYPTFSLDRGRGCEIHENAFWNLQTYLGLRENLAANEGARSFTYDSTRKRTPLGHNHRARIRDLSVPRIRDMYREAVTRLVERTAETREFFQAGSIAIDTTDSDYCSDLPVRAVPGVGAIRK